MDLRSWQQLAILNPPSRKSSIKRRYFNTTTATAQRKGKIVYNCKGECPSKEGQRSERLRTRGDSETHTLLKGWIGLRLQSKGASGSSVVGTRRFFSCACSSTHSKLGGSEFSYACSSTLWTCDWCCKHRGFPASHKYLVYIVQFYSGLVYIVLLQRPPLHRRTTSTYYIVCVVNSAILLSVCHPTVHLTLPNLMDGYHTL